MAALSVVAALGSAMTANTSHVLSVFEFVGGGECSEAGVARLVAAMARTKPHAQPEPLVVAQVLKKNYQLNLNLNLNWDADVFVAAVQERNPQCDWYKVFRCLDTKDFAIFNQEGLSLLLNVFKAAIKDIFKFPIAVFFGRWQNVKGQLSFIKQAILSAPELFSFTLLTSRRVLSDQLLMGKSLPPQFTQQPWNNLDLLETLVILSEVQDALEDVKALFEYAMQNSPELLLIGLAQIPAPWTPLHKEVASTLVIMFLAGNQNSSFVIPLLWQVSPSLVLAGLAHIYSKDPSQIGRILDIVQEIKALSQILDTKHSYFTLDLAVLASRRNYMNLEKWLQDRIQLDRASGTTMFLKGCLEFISDKITAAAANPGVAAFPVDIVATFLRVLRNSPMTPEMAAFFKELLVVSIKVYPQLMPANNIAANNLVNNSFDEMAVTGLGGGGGPTVDLNGGLGGGGPAGGAPGLGGDAEKEANLYYGKLLKGEVSIPQIVDLLRRYRDSANPREQEVFTHFTQVHLDEYKFFPQYPDKQLQITSMLFGALIQDLYVDAKNLANSLRCVLEALRQPVGSKFFKFGSLALVQFQQRLGEWPHYCSLLLQIPHLQQTNPEIVAFVTPLATPQDGGDTAGPGNGDLKNATGRIGAGDAAAGAGGAYAGSGDEKDENKPVFTALKLDNHIPEDEVQEPNDTIKDKILFIINNLTFDNLEEKVEEMKEVLVEEHYRWFSEYLVVKRTSIEPNFHDLYIALLESLAFPPLMKNILHQTYSNIKVLLNSDKTVTSSSERTLLKNLGTWLGSITLAKNRPIKHKNLAFKSLLLEGFESDRLIVVIPFVCKVLEQSHDSKVFKPPNPWLMAIMKLLSELYNYAELKLNLKFEIEVLCKKIQLDIKDIEPAVILRNRPNKLSGQKKPGDPLGLPNPATLTQPNEEGLYPISVYITLPNLPVFNSQPAMKRIVHIAIDRAIREVVVSPVVERSVTIAGIATRELIIKDFALEPDELKMRKAAHLMAQNLAGSLAIVSSRDPLRIGMITQLQNLLRQNGITEHQVSEQVVFMIVSDNLDLACSVMERAAAEKSILEIDESLTSAYLNRRKHRERSSQPYYDVNVYAASRYPSSLPEPLRLKTNGLTQNQYRVYDDFSRIARHAPAGTEAPVERDGRTGRDAAPVVEDQIPAGVIQAMDKLDGALVELDKAIASTMTDSITQLPAQHEIKMVLRQISAFISQFSRDDIFLVAGQKIVAQLFRIDLLLSRECYVLLLERIFDLSKVAAKEIISWFLYAADERRWNADVILIMIRANMMPMHDLDVQLARLLDGGKQEIVDFVVEVIRAVLLGEAPYAAHDAFFNCIAMLRDRVEGNDGVTTLLKDVKTRFSVVSLKGPDGKDLEAGELRESLGVLFSEWVKIYHHPSSSEKTHKEYIVQLQELGVLQEEDVSSLFFRVCTELSVDLYIQAKSAPNVSPLLPFQAVDAFARLIVLLVRYHAESADANGNAAKLDLTTKILYIIVLVLVHSHEQRRGQFNQRPFFRLFSSLLNDLNLFEDELQAVYYQILFKISNTLHTLQPSFLPGFTLSWLQLISHRYFMPKLLSAEGQKGWPFFQRLLIDLFKFLGPFLRQSEMADAIRLLYKAALRILLVLLHDFPEFLCDYHFSFVEVIPHSCIQLRNLILSAFPRNMRLPDPFTPNLKVELLPEINQSPHVMSDYTSTLSQINLKNDLDAFLKTRGPASFLSDLRNRLLQANPQPDDLTKYNLPAINSLVLYVGVQAIAQQQAKGTPPPSSATAPAPSASLDIFQQLIADFDSEGRYLLLSAIANQLRYPNSHTHYFSNILLHMFAEASEEIIQEQITRVLIERLIVNRPHPYGLLITFIDLIRNQRFNFWEHTNFIRCAPEIERLFQSVYKSIQSSMLRT
ncbi:UNVERIFIED_CONTAM: hypothetical protein HDU68_006489 [Siphonaria sp. JEL0065]|nr:hypothetical protein HDU68_006489 [Siphonaria sp. JEL0065]